MFHFKTNIWSLFYFIILIGTTLLSTAVYIKYQEILNETKNEQLYLSKIYDNHLNALFEEHETLHKLIAQEYLKDTHFNNKAFNAILELDPLLLDIWIFSKEGELQYSHFPGISFPNLLQNKKTQKWFQETLNSNEMVIGRAYLLKSIHKWILPIRQKVVDDKGEILAIISTGIDLTQLHNQWQEEDVHQHTIQAILSNSAFPILHTNLTTAQYAQYYNAALPNQMLFNHTISELRTRLAANTEPFIQEITPSKSGRKIYTVTYNERYHFLISAEIPYSMVMQKLYHHCLFYFLFYLLLITLIFGLFYWIVKIEKSKSYELTYKASHDALTGLANCTVIHKYFYQLQRKTETPFALLYIDLDNFKNINDTFGHSYGDHILIAVTERISKSITSHKGMAVRYSGDEFVIFLESDNKKEIEEYAKVLLETISQPYLIHRNTFKISSSIGIARFPDDASDIEALLSYADNSMYMAKKKKNNYLFFSKKVHRQLIRNIEIEQALHHAIRNEEISLVYQPQLDKEEKLFGVEALVRWNSKKLGQIPPDRFISIAEETGLMPKLGLYIMHKAMKEISILQEQSGVEFKLSINVSVRQFIQIDFIEKLMDACHKYMNQQLAITIEITESLFIESLDTLIPLFHKIKANYISLSLDDFGTGYSSLSMLRKVPIDELKIDKSFIDHISDNKNDKTMVKSIIDMGKSLGMSVLAEGVETKEQVDILKNAGCNLFQGYYFSRPLAIQELATFIEKRETKQHFLFQAG